MALAGLVLAGDGSVITIRPLATGDVAAIAAWFDGLGPQTRYERFFTSMTAMDDRTRWQLAHVDHRDHEAMTAVAPDGTGERGMKASPMSARHLSVRPEPGA